MSTFNPFVDVEYHKQSKQQTILEEEPLLTKKSDSQYISECLSFGNNHQNKETTDHSQTSPIAQKQSQQHKIQQSCSSNSSYNSKKNLSKNSPFHNFQKHLVVTLRQILNLKTLQQKVGQQYELAYKIFKYFKTSQKTSRLFLENVFGLVEVKESNSTIEFIEKIRQGQLKGLFQQYSNKTILLAQFILKEYTKKQLEECDLGECLNRRKIQKKQEFIEYINLFKTQLTQGKQRKKAYKLLAKKFQKL